LCAEKGGDGLIKMLNEWQGFSEQLEKAHGSDFVADLCKTFTDQKRAEEEMAFARQRRIAEANARLEQSWMEGFGERHFSIDAEVFFHWVRKLGKDCWNDKQFIAEFKRDNPETIVRNRKRKTSIIRP
jgi:hypothetical protein